MMQNCGFNNISLKIYISPCSRGREWGRGKERSWEPKGIFQFNIFLIKPMWKYYLIKCCAELWKKQILTKVRNHPEWVIIGHTIFVHSVPPLLLIFLFSAPLIMNMKTGFEALTISYWLTKVVPSLFLLLVLLSSASLSFSSWSVNGSEALLGFSVWITLVH